MKKKPEKLLDMQCKRCGKVTHHYLSVNGEVGEYKCVRCQTTNKTIKVKPKRTVVFEMDAEFEAELNPVADKAQEVIDEILNAPDADKLETADGTVLDDQGNPV
jgi:DNA-directed RNA polymerase subunit RPC12/RpoP